MIRLLPAFDKEYDIDVFVSASYGWPVSIKTLDKLRQQAFELDEEARADLAYDLLETISGPVEEAREKWLEEVGRRLADFDAGRTDAAPVEEILKEIDQQLR